MSDFLKTWEGTQAENKWSRIVIGALAVGTVLLAALAFQRQTIVTIQPYTLEGEAWVGESDASKNYKEAWGLAIAQLIGNVSPANVGFIKERLGPLLSPGIYNEAIRVLEDQAAEIRRDRLNITFAPREVLYEPSSGKVFVTGYSETAGLSTRSQAERTMRTYEFVIEITHFLPVIKSIDTYRDRPRNQEYLDREAKKAERRG